MLESYEGGRLLKRCFPTTRDYTEGDYVSWDWSREGVGVGETWIKDPSSGHPLYAWTTSSFFEGSPRSPLHEPRLTGIVLSPRTALSLAPGSAIPWVVQASYADGAVLWRQRIPPGEVQVSSDNEDVLYADKNGVLRSKNFGSAELAAQYQGKYARTDVTVSALMRGTVHEYVGGFNHPRAVASSVHGVLFTYGTDEIMCVDRSAKVMLLAKVLLPPLYSTGVDKVASDDEGNLYVRALDTRGVLCLPQPKFDRAIPISLPDAAPMDVSGLQSGVVIVDHRGSVWSWDPAKLSPERMVTIPDAPDPYFALTEVAATSAHLWVLDNRGTIWRIDRETLDVISTPNPTDDSNNSFSAICVVNGDVYLTDFHGDKVLRLRNDNSIETIADRGLSNPTDISPGHASSLFVANFGTDNIVRIII
jgi:hypothetical protein